MAVFAPLLIGQPPVNQATPSQIIEMQNLCKGQTTQPRKISTDKGRKERRLAKSKQGRKYKMRF